MWCTRAAFTWARGRMEAAVMSNSMHARRTSTSPHSEPPKHLSGSFVPVRAVTLNERREMYALLRAYFEGTSRARFEADLRAKDAVILLRDAGSGSIQGFSTVVRMDLGFEGHDIVTFF